MTASQIDHRELEPSARRISSSPPPPEHGSGAPITELLWETAADEWAATAARVQAVLQRRGVDRHTAEDLVQEVALRILVRSEQFKDATHRERWALTVAWRLAKNRWRDAGRVNLGDPPDIPGGRDPAEVFAARESLQRVVGALHKMSEKDQEAVILGFEPAGQPGAIAVRRHRARARLARVRVGLGLGVVRLRDRVEAIFEPLAPLAMGAVIVLSPSFAEPAEAPASTTSGVGQPPAVVMVVGAAPAPDAPTASGHPAPTSRPPTGAALAKAPRPPAATAGGAVVRVHDQHVRVVVEEKPGPRPLACIVGTCIAHPARGVLTPE